MPSARGLASACAVLLAVAMAWLPATASAATPEEIFADYVAHQGAIAGDYSFEDLRATLDEVAGDPFYADFAGAVDAKLDSALLGRSRGQGGGEAAAAPGGASALPVPRAVDESGDPPWPFIALTVLAGALVVSGAGSSIYRRARR
jgi:hypothetical protein